MGSEMELRIREEGHDSLDDQTKSGKRKSLQQKIGLKRERKDKHGNYVTENHIEDKRKSDNKLLDLVHNRTAASSINIKTNMKEKKTKDSLLRRWFNRKFKKKNTSNDHHVKFNDSSHNKLTESFSSKENGHRTMSVTFADTINDLKLKRESNVESVSIVNVKDIRDLPENGTVKLRKSAKDSMKSRVSTSSPNLTYVEWSSCESVSDEGDSPDNRKRSSLRRSRASLVFPMSEMGSNNHVLGSFLSERNLSKCRNNPGILKPTKSCIDSATLTDDFVDEFHRKYDTTVSSKSNVDDVLTSDRHSAHGGKSPFYAFSLPEIYEEDPRFNVNTNCKSLSQKRKCHELEPFDSYLTVLPDKINNTFGDRQNSLIDRDIKRCELKSPRISQHSDKIKSLRDWLKRGASLDDLAKQKEEERQQISQFANEIRSLNKYERVSRVSKCNSSCVDTCKCASSSVYLSKVQKQVEMDFKYNNSLKEDADCNLDHNRTCSRVKAGSKGNYKNQRPFSLHEGFTFKSDLCLSHEERDLFLGERSQTYSLTPMLSMTKNSLFSRGIPRLSFPEEQQEPEDFSPAIAEALWDHCSSRRGELNFSVGDMVTVYCINDTAWWWGAKDGKTGWFPSSHIRLRVDQDLEYHETSLDTGHQNSIRRQRNALSLLGLTGKDIMADKGDVRTKCIKELVNTERDYVKTLRDVIEGYLKNVRKKTDMFKEEDVRIIFGNIEQLYGFHKKFLRQMCDKISQENPSESELGKLFLDHKPDFDIYSGYCNNHPHACARLLLLQQEKRYKLFFEACRLLQHMISLSIDAFLLTPVQKICKYPLQLIELLKHTPIEHSDYEPLESAVIAMKDVASSINEMKRKVEKLCKLADWQLTIDNWEGADVLERSSEMIKKGTVERMFSGKSQEIQIYLFDHQLILCRKDSVRRKCLVYQGRVDLDSASLGSADVSLDETSNHLLNNVLKISNDSEGTSHILCLKTTDEKDEWLKAFRDERSKAELDLKPGCVIPESVRKAAMDSARRKKLTEPKKDQRRRKSLTDPLFGFDSATAAIRRSLRLRRTQSMRTPRNLKKENIENIEYVENNNEYIENIETQV